MKLDFEEIKRATDFVAVVESYGIEMKREGRDFVGKCPFHEDKHPSMRVTPEKHLYRCPVCESAGNVIQFVAKIENITDKQAAQKLLLKIPGVTRGSDLESRKRPMKKATKEKNEVHLPTSIKNDLLNRVAQFYKKTLEKDRAGLDYLKARGLTDLGMLEHFCVGYANGSLLHAVSQQSETLEQLKALGILRKNGQEFFLGRIVVPIFDEQGNVSTFYSRKIGECPPKDRHRYLTGEMHGVFNGSAVKQHKNVLLVESILDAMSLWQAGYHNVLSLHGKALTSTHQQLLKQHGIKELYLCLDNDPAGQQGIAKIKKQLAGVVEHLYVVSWPEGIKDANEYFQKKEASDFEKIMKAANPELGKAEEKQGEEKIEIVEGGINLTYGPRTYQLRGIEKPSASKLKATVKALHAKQRTGAIERSYGRSGAYGSFHVDTVDFYLSRQRKNFISETARFYRETVDLIESDIGRIMERLENYVAQQIEAKEPELLPPSREELTQGEQLGNNPQLVQELLRDMEALGMVGETVNKLVGYLVMTSRKMDDPLALQILSGSGAGKSHLQDTILSLCPEEEKIHLTSLTGQALFYKGEDSLKHKALAVEEEAGASGASYAIRNLISAKKLSIESTIKNPYTGQHETQVNTVYGPSAVFQTTTNPRTDPETRSRFIIVSIDESPEQTRRILEAQRHSHTLEGKIRKKKREGIVQRHHALQRLLRNIEIINPFEPLLDQRDDRLYMRRDNPKYLQLILVVTFLHQRQRPVRHSLELGDYIETTLEDIGVANMLAKRLFSSGNDVLPGPSQELLERIYLYVQEAAGKKKTELPNILFSRRELREKLRWGETQLRTHLKELVELEYLAPIRGRQGQLYQYRLFYQPEKATQAVRPWLKSLDQLASEAKQAGILPKNFNATSRLQSELRGFETHFAETSRQEPREVTSTVNGHTYTLKTCPSRINGQPINGKKHPEASHA